MSKRYNEPIRVWGDTGEKPQAFVWRGRLYRVQQVIQFWTVNNDWWQKKPEHRQYSLVEASGNFGAGVFELYFEAIKKQWFLSKVMD